MFKIAISFLPVLLVAGCMSAEEKRKVVAEKSATACYAMGYNQGTDAYNRCLAGAGLVYSDQLEREQKAKREDIADRLGAAGAALQSMDYRPKLNCTSTSGIGRSINTTCY
jgi:hypothetical protein